MICFIRSILTIIAIITFIFILFFLWFISFPVIIILPFAFRAIITIPIIVVTSVFYVSIMAGAMSRRRVIRFCATISVIIVGETSAIITTNFLVSILDSRKIPSSCKCIRKCTGTTYCGCCAAYKEIYIIYINIIFYSNLITRLNYYILIIYVYLLYCKINKIITYNNISNYIKMPFSYNICLYNVRHILIIYKSNKKT